jgi:hypothetical protein
MGRSEVRDLNDPRQLGYRILEAKEELKCGVCDAADHVYADMRANGYYLPAPEPAQTGRDNTRLNA